MIDFQSSMAGRIAKLMATA
jgi:hypothetical protein